MNDALDHDLVVPLGIADQITAKDHDAHARAERRPERRGALHFDDPFAPLAQLPNERESTARIVV